jgi:hypothetical protein
MTTEQTKLDDIKFERDFLFTELQAERNLVCAYRVKIALLEKKMAEMRKELDTAAITLQAAAKETNNLQNRNNLLRNLLIDML